MKKLLIAISFLALLSILLQGPAAAKTIFQSESGKASTSSSAPSPVVSTSTDWTVPDAAAAVDPSADAGVNSIPEVEKLLPAASGKERFEYQIGPENVLQIDVYYGKDERISQKVRVSSRGLINFPLVGEVSAGGLTVASLQERLTKLLGADYLVNPQVTVFIEEYSTVSIMGEVKKPGAYPIKGRLTVLELISVAEGFTKIASPNKVKVLRTRTDGSREEIPVRVNDLINKDNQDKDNVVLRAGDMVVVPESLF